MALPLPFGYTLSKDDGNEEEKLNSFAPPVIQDGAIELEDVGTDHASNTRYIYDFDVHFTSEEEKINAYRNAAGYPEVDYAVTDIVNETIVQDQYKDAIFIELDTTEFSKNVQTKIKDEWQEISRLLNLNNDAGELFKRWYIDSKIYFHKIVKDKKEHEGIKEIRYLDPRRIKKVRHVEKSVSGAGQTIESVEEYYIYSLRKIVKEKLNTDTMGNSSIDALRIPVDMIAYAHSGLIDLSSGEVKSHLHKALKPLNQLNLVEDAMVIYRLSRAPERRVFYIDVGNLPKTRAEQYMKNLIDKYKNNFVYDVKTGEVNTSKKNLSMMEDIFLPRREGSKGTEVDTLQGGQNLGEIEDVTYFKQKLYRALNVPISRLEPDSGFNLGRSSEITRDELRFSKFAEQLRKQFNDILYDLLKTQLVLKKIITSDDWDNQKHNVKFIYNKDSYFEELKSQEILEGKLEILERIDPFTDKYFSVEWVRKVVLLQNDDEIKEIDKQIKAEDGEFDDAEEDADFGDKTEPEKEKPMRVVMVDPDKEEEKDEKPQDDDSKDEN